MPNLNQSFISFIYLEKGLLIPNFIHSDIFGANLQEEGIRELN
jgi:hypothetical protein